MLWTYEIGCVAILALYAWLHRQERGWLAEAGLLAAGAWLGEDSCIRLYRFYQYAPTWHLVLDQVPLLVVAIWPAVVMSARSIARALLGPTSAARLALVTGLLVTFDAALIEPLAVAEGLWSWNAPGLFAVPPIGIFGWGLFAAAASFFLESARPWLRAVMVLAAPLVTHAALLACWWGALRWAPQVAIGAPAGIAAIALTSMAYLVMVRVRRVGLPRHETISRAAATSFFAVLLARHLDPWMLGYAAAFTPPYLLLSYQGWRSRR